METSFKNDNLETIQKLHSDIFKLISKGPPESTLDLKIEKSQNGELTLSALTKDMVRIYLHSKYNPTKESVKIIASWEIRKTDTNVLVLGFGLGYLPLAVLERLEPAQNLFIVEPSIEVFLCGVECIDLVPILKRPNTKFFIGPGHLNKLKNHFPETNFKTVFFTHNPSIRLFQELEQAAYYLEGITLPKIKNKLDYPKFKSDVPKALLFETGFFIEKEFKNTLVKLGVPYTSLSVDPDGKVGDADFIRRLIKTLTEFKPDFIFCVNQWGFDQEGKLAGILTHYKIPFVSWYVDNPLPLLLWKNNNASQYGFYLLWDKHYLTPMKNLGFPNVKYLPYATDSTVFFPFAGQNPKRFPVSFVGNSLNNIIKARLKEISNVSYLVEAYHKLTQNLPPQTLNGIDTIDLIKKTIGEKKTSDKQLASLEVAVNSKWTQERRVRALLAIQEFNPHVFGDEGWKSLLPYSSFHFHPLVDYHKELPGIYRATEINLNISNVQLKNSVNQRLFDVCACGSFLLTDRKRAVQRYLAPGEGVETFESYGELREKVEFYLEFPEKREEIAEKGRITILENHTYMHRLEEIFSLLKNNFA